MNEIDISVLIPMYNRKNYIEDCIKSVLNQSFKNFEILVRDDFSTDGVYEFVQKIFSQEIKSGKIKFFRNDKNLGESFNVKKLCEDANGKYITILHNDDLYMPNALEYLFEVAKNFNADVVHSTNFLTSDKDGIIKEGSRLYKISCDKNSSSEIQIMPNSLEFRFNEWLHGGTFQDSQYNLFSRKFILEENLLDELENEDTYLSALNWIMKAKIFVKAPEPVYIRRDIPDSQTNEKTISENRLERTIQKNLKLFHQVDKFLSEVEFFQGNIERKFLVKTKIFLAYESLSDNSILGNTNYAELYNSIEKIFKKYFGKNAVYLALLYHWSHIMQFNKNKSYNILQDCLKILSEEI